MKEKNRLKSIFALFTFSLLALHGYSQEESDYTYSISIEEINTEESAKDHDYVLFPFFDVSGKYDAATNRIQFTSSARIDEGSLAIKLEQYDLHLTYFKSNYRALKKSINSPIIE